MFCTYKHILHISTGYVKNTLIVAIIVFATSFVAKSNPTTQIPRSMVFNRAQSLDNGISISWYEQTWNKDILTKNPLNTADFKLLKQLGFKSLRLPVAFSYFESQNIPVEQIFSHIDNFVKQGRAYGFKVIIDNHGGSLDDSNYGTETPKLIKLWQTLTKRYAGVSRSNLFFELYNEPPHMNPQTWKDA